MNNVLLILPLLACPIGMGLCIWLMARGMRHRSAEAQGEVPPSIEQLREQQRRLESEIDRLEGAQAAESPTAGR